jgi:hypothetical protein
VVLDPVEIAEWRHQFDGVRLIVGSVNSSRGGRDRSRLAGTSIARRVRFKKPWVYGMHHALRT